jgi:hypothetical protein
LLVQGDCAVKSLKRSLNALASATFLASTSGDTRAVSVGKTVFIVGISSLTVPVEETEVGTGELLSDVEVGTKPRSPFPSGNGIMTVSVVGTAESVLTALVDVETGSGTAGRGGLSSPGVAESSGA